MEPSASTNGNSDSYESSQMEEENVSRKECQSSETRELGDAYDDNSIQTEGDQIKEPLLSPPDRRQSPVTRKTVQFSPFRKSKEINKEDIQELNLHKVNLSPHLKKKYSTNESEPSSIHKDSRQNVPLLLVTAEPQAALNPESTNVEGISEPKTVDKCVGHDDYELRLPRYTGKRRQNKWDAVGQRAKESRAKASKEYRFQLDRHRKWKFIYTLLPDPKKELTKAELLKTYRLHIFVSVIFVIIVLSVSLSWYFKNEAQEKLYSSQAIFFNPRTRELTLTDSRRSVTIYGRLGNDIPAWMLPLHCPIVMAGDPHKKQCEWKGIAKLRIWHFQRDDIQCYNVSWESSGAQYLPHDCFFIHKAEWYGPSNQSDGLFPIKGQFSYRPDNYILNNNGLFSSVVDFYWLSSSGAAIYVNSDDPIQMRWNISGDNQFCISSNFSGPLYYKDNSLHHPVMNYTICQGTDPISTHKFMQTLLAPKTTAEYPYETTLQKPHWSLRNLFKRDNVTQKDVIDLANNISEHGFDSSVITLDANWQKSHGDLDFDKKTFFNVTEMIDAVNTTGCRLTLSVSPYFQYSSSNFHEGVINSFYVKDAGGQVSGLTHFQGGVAAILDVFAENSRQWYSEKLLKLEETYKIKSFRLTYGHRSWLPYKPHFLEDNATPNMYRKYTTELFSALTDSSLVVEHTSDSRHVTSLIPVSTRLSRDKKCLTGIIESALTLGLMGYPFVMADGIHVEEDADKVTHEADSKPSRELYIRWLQLAASFPAYQYSIAPWEYDNEVVSIARNVSIQHNTLVLKEIMSKEVEEDVRQGLPILRPVWWFDSSNSSAHDSHITDAFLIGKNILVAPILCEGITERDIFIPSGIWENIETKSIKVGPQIIREYNVTQDKTVMFLRRD